MDPVRDIARAVLSGGDSLCPDRRLEKQQRSLAPTPAQLAGPRGAVREWRTVEA